MLWPEKNPLHAWLRPALCCTEKVVEKITFCDSPMPRVDCAKNAAAAAEPGSSTQHQFAKKEILFLIVHAVVVSQKY